MENVISAFNTLNAAMTTANEMVSSLASTLESETVAYNTLIEEYNELFDRLEAFEAQKIHDEENARKAVESLMKQRNIAIEGFEKKSLELSALRNEMNVQKKSLKDLQALDPVRLAKVNKTQKAQIATLKEQVASIDSDRKRALEQHKVMLKKSANNGVIALHVFDNGNSLRFAPKVFVKPNNDFGGAGMTPVVEFFHEKAGVMRLGNLMEDGSLGWSSATNSMPTQEESNLALFKIHEFCDAHKIKYPKAK